MEQPYTIVTDPARQMVRLRLVGHWDRRTVDAYREDVGRAMAKMAADGGRSGEYLLLIDVREQGVQSQEVASACQAIVAAYSPMVRRSALLTSPSALHQLQSRRISGQVGRGCFRDEEEAIAFLLA